MPSVEEIENRINHTKNILHKCALEGKINIGLMISDIEYLLNEIKNLVNDNNDLYKKINQRYGTLCKELGSYVRDEATPEQERIAGGINELRKLKNELLNENHIPRID